MSNKEPNFTAARHNMVESQVRPNGITDHRIIDAMAQVKREDFVPAERDLVALDARIVHDAAAVRAVQALRVRAICLHSLGAKVITHAVRRSFTQSGAFRRASKRP